MGSEGVGLAWFIFHFREATVLRRFLSFFKKCYVFMLGFFTAWAFL